MRTRVLGQGDKINYGIVMVVQNIVMLIHPIELLWCNGITIKCILANSNNRKGRKLPLSCSASGCYVKYTHTYTHTHTHTMAILYTSLTMSREATCPFPCATSLNKRTDNLVSLSPTITCTQPSQQSTTHHFHLSAAQPSSSINNQLIPVEENTICVHNRFCV